MSETDRGSSVIDPRSHLSQSVAGFLTYHWPDECYVVEAGTVEVAFFNETPRQLAESMAQELVQSENIPCSLVRDDDGVFDGVEFDYFDPDSLADNCSVDTDTGQEADR